MAEFILALGIGLFVGCAIGWIFAHQTIATECERLGSFYVGKKVFHCTKVEAKE